MFKPVAIGAVAFLLVFVLVIAMVRCEQKSSALLLPMNFAHIDHQDTGCADCHHNYVDDTGMRLCLDCHKTDVEISADIETQFHVFCRGCHVKKQAEGEDSGPTRACFSCHEGDDLP